MKASYVLITFSRQHNWGCVNEIKLSAVGYLMQRMSLCFNKAALSSCAEQVRKTLRHKDDDKVTTKLLPHCCWSWVCCWWSSPRHLSDHLNRTWRSLQGVKERSQYQQSSTHKQTNKQGWRYWWWTAAHSYPALFLTTVTSVSSVHWWQQSPFFSSAQCEHCEANMTLTLHFLQRPSQSSVLHIAEISL